MIYYRLNRLSGRKGCSRWGAALSELHALGAEAGNSQVWVCQPVGLGVRVRNPLQIIGTTGGADISSLASRTALAAFAPGPINAVDPDPFPAPQVQTYNYSSRTTMDSWGGPNWGTVKSFLLSTTVDALTADFPEAEILTEVPSVARALTRDALGLAA